MNKKIPGLTRIGIAGPAERTAKLLRLCRSATENSPLPMVAAERFRAAIAAADWRERQITVSVGASTLTPTVHDATALIGQADAALYRSKERGRNRVTHSKETAERESLAADGA